MQYIHVGYHLTKEIFHVYLYVEYSLDSAKVLNYDLADSSVLAPTTLFLIEYCIQSCTRNL
jgi:hypothetical protein